MNSLPDESAVMVMTLNGTAVFMPSEIKGKLVSVNSPSFRMALMSMLLASSNSDLYDELCDRMESIAGPPSGMN